MVTKSPSPSPSPTPPPNERTDSDFNATDWEMVSFEVEKQKFYAPISKFKHAKMSPGKDNPLLAIWNRTPSDAKCDIELNVSDITAEDFKTLLRVMYPPGYSHVETSPQTSTLSNENWISVLKISSLWFFQELRDLALRHLDNSSISIMDKIYLGRAYNVPTWLFEGLCALADSNTFINSTMSDELGEATALRLHQIRDRKLLPQAREDTDSGVFSTTYIGVSDDVKCAFSDELEECERAFQVYETSFPGLTSISFPPAYAGSDNTESSESISSEFDDQAVSDEPTVADSCPPFSLSEGVAPLTPIPAALELGSSEEIGRDAETPVAPRMFAESYSSFKFSFGENLNPPIPESLLPSTESLLLPPVPASVIPEPVQPTPDLEPLPAPLSEAVDTSEELTLKSDSEKMEMEKEEERLLKENADSAARLTKPEKLTEEEKKRIGDEAVVRAASLTGASLQLQKLTKAKKKKIRQEAIERAARLAKPKKLTGTEKTRIGDEAVAASLARVSLQPQKLTKAEKKKIREEAIERAARISLQPETLTTNEKERIREEAVERAARLAKADIITPASNAPETPIQMFMQAFAAAHK